MKTATGAPIVQDANQSPAARNLRASLLASMAINGDPIRRNRLEAVMPEPTSSAAGGLAAWKAVGGLAGMAGIGAGLAAIVVMCLMTPRSPREWACGLISTVMGSIGGGAAVVQYYGLQSWAHTTIGLVGLLGLVFACGLPAWAVVRAAFTWLERRKDKDLGELVQDARKVVQP